MGLSEVSATRCNGERLASALRLDPDEMVFSARLETRTKESNIYASI